MKLTFIYLFLAAMLFSCETTVKPNKSALLGEWHYVGTFSTVGHHFLCDLCPDFNYEESIYRLNFETENQFSGRINLLIATGSYEISDLIETELSVAGNIAIQKLQILNKPPETEADTEFQKTFNLSSRFQLTFTENDSFDLLRLSNDTSYLLFARKK